MVRSIYTEIDKLVWLKVTSFADADPVDSLPGYSEGSYSWHQPGQEYSQEYT